MYLMTIVAKLDER